jgi:hypothetical protein
MSPRRPFRVKGVSVYRADTEELVAHFEDVELNVYLELVELTAPTSRRRRHEIRGRNWRLTCTEPLRIAEDLQTACAPGTPVIAKGQVNRSRFRAQGIVREFITYGPDSDEDQCALVIQGAAEDLEFL